MLKHLRSLSLPPIPLRPIITPLPCLGIPFRCRDQVMLLCGGDLLDTFEVIKDDGEPLWLPEDRETILTNGIVCIERKGTDLEQVWTLLWCCCCCYCLVLLWLLLLLLVACSCLSVCFVCLLFDPFGGVEAHGPTFLRFHHSLVMACSSHHVPLEYR